MRNNTRDDTLNKSCIQKYQHLLSEDELVWKRKWIAFSLSKNASNHSFVVIFCSLRHHLEFVLCPHPSTS